jgi:hypothetical protein
MAHVDFDVFRAVALEWLGTAPTLDPQLAAAAELLMAAACERRVVDLAVDMNDVHGAFGAAAVLELWKAVQQVQASANAGE